MPPGRLGLSVAMNSVRVASRVNGLAVCKGHIFAEERPEDGKPVTCLWFDRQAFEAARFCTQLFPNSSLETQILLDSDGNPAEAPMTVQFTLNGNDLAGHNGGQIFSFTEGCVLPNPLCGSAGNGSSLGRAHGAEGSKPMRLTQRPLCRLVASGARTACGIDETKRSSGGTMRCCGLHAHEGGGQCRPRTGSAGLRSKIMARIYVIWE